MPPAAWSKLMLSTDPGSFQRMRSCAIQQQDIAIIAVAVRLNPSMRPNSGRHCLRKRFAPGTYWSIRAGDDVINLKQAVVGFTHAAAAIRGLGVHVVRIDIQAQAAQGARML